MGKGTWGGPGRGGGRRTRAVELGLPMLISETISDEENQKLIAKIFEMGLQGSFPHAKLYLEYKYGKPQENITLGIEQKHSIDLSKLNKTEVIQLHELTSRGTIPQRTDDITSEQDGDRG